MRLYCLLRTVNRTLIRLVNWLVLLREPTPPNQSITTISVVVAAAASDLESMGVIETGSGRVVTGHLQSGVAGAFHPCPLQQGVEQGTTETAAAATRIHRQCGDVQLIGHEPAAGQSQKELPFDQAETQPLRLLQFAAPLLLIPQPPQAALIQVDARGQPGGVEIDDGDD